MMPPSPRRHTPVVVRRLGASALLLGLIASAGLASAAAPAPPEQLDVPPLIEVTHPDGSKDIERSGSWKISAPSRADATLSTRARDRRRLLFLLDLSASMPEIHGRAGDYAAVIADATARAKRMLEPYRGSPYMVVSFYTFGDLRRDTAGQWRPHVEPVEGAIGVSVDAAITRLDHFIPLEPEAYDEPWTYVAASVFEATRRELDLPADPSLALPNDAPPVTIFVFTDAGERALGGGESHAKYRHYDHERYAGWLVRHQQSQQIEYHYWNLEADNVKMLPDKARITYTLSWGQPGRVDTFNRQEALANHRRTLDLYPLITAAPALAALDTAGAITCPRRDEDGLVEIPRGVLRLKLADALTFNIGAVESYAEGRHPVRFDADVLCAELTRVYPNSEFVLPSSGGQIAPLGFVEVVDEPRYLFDLVAEGATPKTPLPPLVADWGHQYAPVHRAFRVIPPAVEGLEVAVDWSVSATLDGAPLEALDDLVTLTASGASGLAVTSPAGSPVELRLPAITQDWTKLGADFDYPPGDYSLRLCATVRVVAAPKPVYHIAARCPDCAPGVEASGEPERICAELPLRLGSRPLGWWWWLVIAVTALIITYIVTRYLSAPELPRRLELTLVEPGVAPKTLRLHPQKRGEGWATRAVHRYRRRPRFISLYLGGIEPTFKRSWTERADDRQAASDAEASGAATSGAYAALAYGASTQRGGLRLWLCSTYPQVRASKDDGGAWDPLGTYSISESSPSVTVDALTLAEGYHVTLRESGTETLSLYFHTKDLNLSSEPPAPSPRRRTP